MLDKTLVEAKIKELNDAEVLDENKKWTIDSSLSVFAVTGIDKTDDGQIAFQPNRGIPLAVFANGNTGEVKLYDARHFGLKI